MSSPRRVLPGRTCLITRRCSERRFFLKPVRRALAIQTYCLAYAFSQHEVELHALVWSTNHYHLVVTDHRGELPALMQRLNGPAARAMNAHLGRGESLWARGSYSKVELLDRESVLEKLVYVLTNMTKDGLVRRPEQWPGLVASARDIGTRTIHATRPDFFFRSDPKHGLPETARVSLTVPPGFEDLGPDGFRDLLEERVERRLEEIYAERRAQGKRRFLGVRAIMSRSPNERAGDTFPDRELNPRIACRDAERRIEALEELQQWHADYREAFERWRAGARRVLFPAGTYAMGVVHGARVRSARAPPAAA